MKVYYMYSNVEYSYSSLACVIGLSSEKWVQLQYFSTEICGGKPKYAVRGNFYSLILMGADCGWRYIGG
jgi:hypothetical protein